MSSPERIRLSDRTRAKLLAMAEATDTDPSFLLEYLINRFGKSALAELSGTITTQQGDRDSLVQSSGTIPHCPALTSTNGKGEVNPIDAFAAMDF